MPRFRTDLLALSLVLGTAAVEAQVPRVSYPLTAFDSSFREGARYSLAVLPAEGGAERVRVVCFRQADRNKFYWLDLSLLEEGIAPSGSAAPARVDVNTNATLRMVRFWPEHGSFLVAGFGEHSGGPGGRHEVWTHVAFSEHDARGEKVGTFFAIPAPIGNPPLPLHWEPADLCAGGEGEVCLTGFVRRPPSQPLDPDLPRVRALPFFCRFASDGSQLEPGAPLATATLEDAADTEWLGAGIARAPGGEPVLLIQRRSADRPPEISARRLGALPHERVRLDFDLPAGSASAFAIGHADSAVVVAGPHSVGGRASLRVAVLDLALRQQRCVDLPASTIDRSGRLPAVHDLVVLGSREHDLRVALITTVGPTTSLVYLPAL